MQAKFSFMIDKIRIRNYKSIVDLTLELGRFNVIIGTNGCGKSNILEAITMASAASQNKLDNANLQYRNIRTTEPQFMVNAFEDSEIDPNGLDIIQIDVKGDEKIGDTNVALIYAGGSKEWVNLGDTSDLIKVKTVLDAMVKAGIKGFDEYKESNFNIAQLEKERPDLYKLLKETIIDKPSLASYITYRPIERIMRNMEESLIYPLGTHGEGLFQYLKEISGNNEYAPLFVSIDNGLRILDWFDGVEVPEDLLSKEYKLSISDKYLKESLHHFDQRSTNEGFLYLLLFITLFNSKDTPQFFAVDNIETSFNPGLCQKLSKYLSMTSKEMQKQVILTTHNPYILDGLDLSDDEQRLFVCRRDIDGHTRIERIKYRENRKMPLSELWMSGLIGALPDNF